jgi:hypothetical protein
MLALPLMRLVPAGCSTAISGSAKTTRLLATTRDPLVGVLITDLTRVTGSCSAMVAEPPPSKFSAL